MAKIVTLGELMLRLSSSASKRFVQSDSFDVNYGGGEANVAVSLQNFGNEAFFVSKIPAHEIGQAAINSLRRFGVHVKYVARGGSRLGIYYLETGSSLRPSKVIYDRAHSSISAPKSISQLLTSCDIGTCPSSRARCNLCSDASSVFDASS